LQWVLEQYVKSCFAEQCMALGSISINFEDYCILRTHMSCTIAIYVFASYCYDHDLSRFLTLENSDSPIHSIYLEYLTDVSNGVANLLNDCISGNKEQSMEGCVNALKVLKKLYPDASVQSMSESIESTINVSLEKSESKLEDQLIEQKILLEEQDLKVLSDWRIALKGLTDWQTVAERYQKHQSNTLSFPRIVVKQHQRDDKKRKHEEVLRSKFLNVLNNGL